jgi:hypothetical protein
LIYIIFIALFLAAEAIHKRPALKYMDVDEKNRALKRLYERSTSKPVASALKNILCAIDYIPVPEPGIDFRLKEKTAEFY